MSPGDEAVIALTARLQDLADELSDLAIDALQRATSGDPDSAETGEALALERRVLKARRALEKSIAALDQRSARAGFDDGAG